MILARRMDRNFRSIVFQLTEKFIEQKMLIWIGKAAAVSIYTYICIHMYLKIMTELLLVGKITIISFYRYKM